MIRKSYIPRFLYLIPLILILQSNCNAQTFDVDTLRWSGSSNTNLNLVILGDGYQSHELEKFVEDAQIINNNIFNATPFSEYRNYFNVIIIKVPSNESGAASDPAELIDNYFGSTFGVSGIARLLVPTNKANISNVLANNFPEYDEVVMLVNTSIYGGSGGWVATASTHTSSVELVLHEFGHSFGNLRDEYWAGATYAREGTNMTQETNLGSLRWRNWYGDYGIGLYPHAESPSWYRPHQNCKMRALGQDFCSVCCEGIIENIHASTLPILNHSPYELNISVPVYPIEFNVELNYPQPDYLNTSWHLNGTTIENNTDNATIQSPPTTNDFDTLIFSVEDNTPLLRVDDHSNIHTHTVMWVMENFETPYLNVTPNTRTIDYTSGSTSFTVSTNVAWSVSQDASWLIATQTNQETISVSYNENNTSSPRTANITASGTGGLTETVTLVQNPDVPAECPDSYEPNEYFPSAATPYQTLGASSYTGSISATINDADDQDYYRLNITEEGTLTVYMPDPPFDIDLALAFGPEDWLTNSIGAGISSETMTWEVEETGSYHIYAYAAYGDYSCDYYNLEVNWAPSTQTDYLDVTPNERNIDHTSGSTSFNINTNVAWSVSHDASWLIATQTNQATISVSYNENNTASPRTAYITATGTGGLTETVTLTQSAPQNPCDNIIPITGCGPGYTQTFTSDSRTGAWNPIICGYESGGIEQVYSFVAPETGTYSIELTATDDHILYGWNTNCNPTEWYCIGDLSYQQGSYGNMEWITGNTYYILLKDLDNASDTHQFHINCPDLSSNLSYVSDQNSLSVNGTNVNLSLRVASDGSATAGECYVGYYLSSDLTISSSDYFIDEDYVPSLVAGDYSDESVNVDVTSANPDIPAGTYYVGYLIDYQNVVNESNETDNAYLFSSPQVTIPDTYYLDITPGNRPVSSASGTTYFTVNSNTEWEVEDDATWLYTSKTNSTTIDVSYDANTTSSSRTANIRAWGPGEVEETVTVTQEYSIEYPNLIPYKPSDWENEIVISSVKGTNQHNDVIQGHVSYIDFAWMNTGDVAAGNHRTCIYLDSEPIKCIDINSFPAGYQYIINDWEYTFDESDWHLIEIIVDVNNEVTESNEGDNIYQKQIYVNSSVDIENTHLSDSIIVYPNPTTGKFNLEISNARKERYVIEIFDATGKILWNQQIENQESDLRATIDISGNPCGLYILKVNNSSSVRVKKIILKD